MSNLFEIYGRYYNLLYRDKDYAAETAYVDGLLKRHQLKGRRLLEFGSGTGIHGRLLAQRGYLVTGIERSADMVAKAEPAPGFSCRQGDIRTVQVGETFDAVLSLFHVLSYQVSNEDIQATFARAADHLGPGGLFVFDIWYSPAVYALRPVVRVKRMSDGPLQVTRIAEPVMKPNENRIDVHYTIHLRDDATGERREFEEVHPMRHFSLPELDLLASAAGFTRLGAEEFLTAAPPGENTWGVCLVYRKRG